MRKIVYLIACCGLVLLSGCGPMTSKQAARQDYAELDARQLFDRVAGNSLILSAHDFSGTVYFDRDGLLAAVDKEDQRDVGTWDITEENQLCLKFRLWYYGDTRCYAIFDNPEADRLTFFTGNGAAYYTAMSVSGDPAGLARQLDKAAAPRSVRQELAGQQDRDEAPAAAETPAAPAAIPIAPSPAADPGQTAKRLAGDCPGCKMSGIDLREASLVKANLQGADLSGADLRYANLRRANLSGANLAGARLNHANLPGADLSGADLSNADLSGANLLLTNLSGAVLSGVNLTGANLEKTIGLTGQP